jgi:hypothetical protein
LDVVEFVYNATRALGIVHPPYAANFGFYPQEPLNMLIITRPSIPVLQDATERLHMLPEAHAMERSVLQLHKDEIRARSEPSTTLHFVRREKVAMVTKSIWLRGHHNMKQTNRQLGSFKVEEHIG